MADLSKTTAYAVLGIPPDENVSKTTAYVVLAPAPLTATATVQTYARADGSVLFAGVVLSATAGVQTTARMSTPLAQIALAGHLTVEARARLAQLPVPLPIAGRVVAQASVVLTEPQILVFNGRLKVTTGAAAGAVVVPAARTRQYAVTINARA